MSLEFNLETYGDGLISAYELSQNGEGAFRDAVCIAFSHIGGLRLEHDTRLAVYGTAGDPKMIFLKNPMNR